MGPFAGLLTRLAAASLLVSRLRGSVLRDGGGGRPTYLPWLSFSLRYLKDTGIRPHRSMSDTIANAFTQAFR